MNFILYLFLAIGLVQILYWLFYFIGILRLRPVDPAKVSTTEGISVVVAANNELDNLKKLIPAVLNQEYPNFELIVINDRSSDGTLEYLYELSQLHEHLQVRNVDDIPDHVNGKKYALTLGIKAAQFENILFTDADCVPSSNGWIVSMASGFNNKKEIVLGYSSYQRKPGFLNYFIRYETLLTGIEYLAAAKMGAPYMGVGRNLGYQKSLFLNHKGYRGYQDIVGGDDDLFVNKHASSKNTAVVVGTHSTTRSTAKTTWGSYFKQKVRHLAVGKLYKFPSKFFLSLFNISWIMVLLMAVPTYLLTKEPNYVLYLLGGRILLIIITFFVAQLKLGIAFNVLGVLFMDFIFAIYYIFAGTRALFAKTIKWR